MQNSLLLLLYVLEDRCGHLSALWISVRVPFHKKTLYTCLFVSLGATTNGQKLIAHSLLSLRGRIRTAVWRHQQGCSMLLLLARSTAESKTALHAACALCLFRWT